MKTLDILKENSPAISVGLLTADMMNLGLELEIIEAYRSCLT